MVFSLGIEILFIKKTMRKILNIVCIVHYVVKTLTLNTRAELILLGTSTVMLIKRYRKQKERNLELIYLSKTI